MNFNTESDIVKDTILSINAHHGKPHPQFKKPPANALPSSFRNMQATPSTVPFTYQDRQWDARFNVQESSDLDKLTSAIQREFDSGRLRYVLIGGVEIGTRPYQDDYQVKHVHVCAIFHNRVSKSSILKNWDVKQGNGYYLVPRNRDLPYSGWKNHHIKEFSKVDKSKCCLLELGELPTDEPTKKKAGPSELEKKRKIDDILIDMRELLEKGEDKEAFTKYPRNFLIYGERLKATIVQKRDFFKSNGDPHIWLHGYPGTGKTAVLNMVYPTYFKKNLHNKFFDLYDPTVHTHVMLEDLDHIAVETLSINFIKTICDETGFAIDQKYKTPQPSRTTVLVTSNFTIPEIIPDGLGIEENKQALMRRFWHVGIYELLRILDLKLIPKWDRDQLKKEGNQDVSKLFITWDYATNCPLGKPLEKATVYQQKIKDAFYK